MNDRPPGGTSGAEVHLALLAEGLRRAGDEVVVHTPQAERLGWRRAGDVWDRAARRRLDAVAAELHPEVVHHHNVLRELSPSVLAAARGVPSVLTVHDQRLLGTADAAADGRARRAAVAAAALLARVAVRRWVDEVIAVDDATARRLELAGLGPVTCLPLFAEDPGPPGAGAGEGTDVVFAGRLAPDKGALDLVTAFLRVAPRHPGSTLVLAGDGPLRAAVEARAAAAAGRIRVLGAVPHDEAMRLMASARAVAVPSAATETGPQTVLEAALRARPVVTTDAAPLSALVRRCDGGIVVAPGDATALADALDRLLGDPAAAAAAGDRAWAAARAHHTPAVAVPLVRELYGRLVAGARR